MTTQLLIVPFTATKNKCPQTEAAINQAFGGSAQNVAQLSKNVKSANPDSSSFRQYIPMLGALMDAKVPTSYTSPFSRSEVFESQDGAVEIINTLWNYLCLLQNDMLQIDSSNQDSLREFKQLAEDASACIENLSAICREYSHPFFTSSLMDYARSYNKYCIAIWQVAIVQSAKKNQNLVARQALQAVEMMRLAEQSARQLPESVRTYVMPIARSTLAYYRSFVFFQLGNYNMNCDKAGLGCQCYRAGVRYINQSDAKIDFAPLLANAITFMKRAVTTSSKMAEERNRDVYNSEVIHDGDPELPKALPLQQISPTKELLISLFFADTQAVLDDDPFADIPSGPPVPGGSNGGFVPPPGSNGSNGGMTSPEPGFNPQSDVPIAPPPGSSGFVPQSNMIQPPVLDDPWSQSQVPGPAQAEPFPVWDIVLSMKEKCKERAQQLLNKQTVAQDASILLQQMSQANQNDMAIQTLINNYKSGVQTVDQKIIEQRVQEGLQFYSNVDARLTKLENK